MSLFTSYRYAVAILAMAFVSVLCSARISYGEEKTPDGATIHRDMKHGNRVTFITVPRDQDGKMKTKHAFAKPSDALNEYGHHFGVTDVTSQLDGGKMVVDKLYGHQHTTYKQKHKGVPVFGGTLKIHLDANGNFTSANGDIFQIPEELSVIPQIGLADAVKIAMDALNDGSPAVEKADLIIVDTGWYGRRSVGTHLAWHIILNGSPDPIRELFFIDAINGTILDRWSMILNARNREIYDGQGTSNLPGALVRSEGDPPVTGSHPDVNLAYDYYADVYGYFYRAFGRDGIDDEGMTMQATVHSTALSCPNAYWDGTRMVFCDGLVVDDVVAHELMHGITEYTANLVYCGQPGQLNESFSDIFGELIDLFNGNAAFPGMPGGTPTWPTAPDRVADSGLDTPNNLRTGCSSYPGYANGVRWLVAEDASDAFGEVIRDMWDPHCTSKPDRANDDTIEEWCYWGDNDGVHYGSSIPNHAFALLVDGGVFNGQTIVGIGPKKAGAIWYRALNAYLCVMSDFKDAYYALIQSANDLIGEPIHDPRNGGVFGQSVTADDVLQVEKSLLAVEMNTDGRCGSTWEPVPSVTTVDVKSNFRTGMFGIGQTILIDVHFNRRVRVTGSPGLKLQTNNGDRQAVYTSGSGTLTLQFAYTVILDDMTQDLDYVDSNALVLNDGTIRAAADYGSGGPPDAIRTLPEPGTRGSLGDYANILIIGKPPTLTAMWISDGATCIALRTVTLDNYCTDMPQQYLASESPDFAGAVWQAYKTAPLFELSDGAGTKTVYFKTKNISGESQVVSGSIEYESGIAAIQSFSINNGSSYTTDRSVLLNNVCVNSPLEYMASESPDYAGANWVGYPHTAPIFVLSPGVGTKTIYFKVRNAVSGCITGTQTQDSITLINRIVAWGNNDFGQCNVPTDDNQHLSIAAGEYHSLALTSQGSVVAWGNNANGQCTLPANNTNFTAIAAGSNFSAGLRNGKLVLWGAPGLSYEPYPSLTFTSIASSYLHLLAIEANGHITTWGSNTYGQRNVPSPNADFLKVSAGKNHSLGLKSDGSIVAWGSNSSGQCNVQHGYGIDIAAGDSFSLSRVDGNYIASWGLNNYGQCDVPACPFEECYYMYRYVAISAGARHGLGINELGGYVNAWGDNSAGQCDVPYPYKEFIAIAAGGYHSLGLRQTSLIASLAINNGATLTANQSVILNNTSAGNPTHYMASESSDFAGAIWLPYNPVPTFTLSNTTGTSTVYFKVRNAWGESEIVSDTITFVDPIMVSFFAINNGEATTSTSSVTLNNACINNPTQYMASESANFEGAIWQSYSIAPSFTLSNGMGIKTIYFKVRNDAGESESVNDTIQKSSEGPIITYFRIWDNSPPGDPVGVGYYMEGQIQCENNPTEYMISLSPNFYDAEWLPYSEFVSFHGGRTVRVYCKVRNENGDESPTVSDDYVVCYTPEMDTNGDLHVDPIDFDVFSACSNGPTSPVGVGCYCVDVNGDHFVDSVDFDRFSACYNGPLMPPSCQ